MRSATSKVGRLILVCAVSATVAVEPGPRRQSFQAGRWPPADAGWKRADSGRWPRYPCAPSEPEWCADPRHLRACGLQSSAARRHRGAHNFVSAKICYRYHPRYGAEVELVRYLRRGSAAVVVVRLSDGPQLALPE